MTFVEQLNTAVDVMCFICAASLLTFILILEYFNNKIK